jgi:3-methylcrotonyl-CoA carboxylase alpha subunit
MAYFNTILIANRGEIAVRIIRACRELGVTAVAVASAADRDALHVRQADAVVMLDPVAGPRAYLDVGLIIDAATQSGAQAIHPGYGFLSERAHFARACRDAHITFIGPPPEAIELMGSKIAAKRLAETVGVPTVPGYMEDDQRRERLRAEAERIGFPLLIKASAGGGGKGMRTVQAMDEFDAALEGAKREALAAFGDDAVFLERLILRPRHIEIQVLADAHGACVHLFERECSIQRRHQKIIEESPSVALSPALRAEMGAAAVRLAQAAGYCNAGTVEFMLDEQGHYYFLEINTRLQVEHPVTELVTGLDLVHLQIAVAAGEPLPFAQVDLTQRGHAIEARVYAEDPVTFLPSIGRIALFAPPEGPGIRNDVGLESGDEVTVNYDPMLAKLIVHAPDRAAAIARLQRALDEYAALGVTTNLPLLRAIAADASFAAGATTTDFLTINEMPVVAPSEAPPEVLAAVALWEAMMDDGRRTTNDRGGVLHTPWQRGPWRLMGDAIRLRYTFGDIEHLVVVTRNLDGWHVAANSVQFGISVVAATNDRLILHITDVAHALGSDSPDPFPTPDSQPLILDPLSSVLRPPSSIERFRLVREGRDRIVLWRGVEYHLSRVGPLSVDTLGNRTGARAGHTGMEAPMPGTVIKVLVEEGQPVAEHQPLIVLEAMKMEHIVAAPYSGIVSRVYHAPGALVAKGVTLVELDQEDVAG